MPLLSKVNATASRIANPGREQSLQNPCKKVAQKIKRAGPSHKPHPKATCPHPTRPLRPPGRRAHRDYAQVKYLMQMKQSFFLIEICSFIISFGDSYHQVRCGMIDSIACKRTITNSSSVFFSLSAT